jgi:hypothetical protein
MFYNLAMQIACLLTKFKIPSFKGYLVITVTFKAEASIAVSWTYYCFLMKESTLQLQITPN